MMNSLRKEIIWKRRNGIFKRILVNLSSSASSCSKSVDNSCPIKLFWASSNVLETWKWWRLKNLLSSLSNINGANRLRSCSRGLEENRFSINKSSENLTHSAGISTKGNVCLQFNKTWESLTSFVFWLMGSMDCVLLTIVIVFNWSNCEEFLDSNFLTQLSCVLDEIEFARDILVIIMSYINDIGSILDGSFKISHVCEFHFRKFSVVLSKSILEIQISLNIIVARENISYNDSFILAWTLKSTDNTLCNFVGTRNYKKAHIFMVYSKKVSAFPFTCFQYLFVYLESHPPAVLLLLFICSFSFS